MDLANSRKTMDFEPVWLGMYWRRGLRDLGPSDAFRSLQGSIMVGSIGVKDDPEHVGQPSIMVNPEMPDGLIGLMPTPVSKLGFLMPSGVLLDVSKFFERPGTFAGLPASDES